ncbi:hypothetical protein Paes_0423 [Prosthecochloris aestuarii DSM 271]|uniref:Uncharacterized protein n=1 Tax=Prosthecochloris aestuarii (strain DSM 271 / SK 413) TaxID=290512 RepID=B4S4Y2_PROA2|nr:hypothetical protein Paes_0423 [Prosthecochloris aestuarii DSM 271]
MKNRIEQIKSYNLHFIYSIQRERSRDNNKTKIEIHDAGNTGL